MKNLTLITGASSGIGKATAYEFAKNGHPLILTGRRADLLYEWADYLKKEFEIKVKVLAFDIRDLGMTKSTLEQMDGEWKKIDILINNAGLAKGFDPIHEAKIDHWETMIDTNIKGLLYMTRLVSPQMVERRRGHIINVCSTAGHEVYPKGNVYCATKHAVDALTKAMRIDLYTHNIKVSQISPAHVEETEFALVRFDGDVKRAKIYDQFQPLKSRDVAESIYFMASRPPHVNIQDILIMATQQASSTNINKSGRTNS